MHKGQGLAVALVAFTLALVLSCGSSAPPKRLETDYSGLSVAIDSPLDGEVRRPGALLLQGRLVGAKSGIVLVNGVETAVTDGAFIASLQILESGTHQLVVSHPDSGKSSSVTLHIDGSYPRLEVISPATIAARVAPDSQLDLVLKATDDGELAEVKVNGQIVAADPDGYFRSAVQLVAGVNRIKLEATDAAGNLTRKVLAVPYGEAIDPTAHQPQAIHVVLGKQALDLVSKSVAAYIDGLPLAQLATAYNPLTRFGSIEVNVSKFSTTGPFTVALTPMTDALALSVGLPALDLSVSVGETDVRVTADSFAVSVVVGVASDKDGTLETTLGEVVLTPKNLVLRIANNELLAPGSSLYTQAVAGINALVKKLLADNFVTAVSAALAAVGELHTVELLGQTLSFSTSIDKLSVSPNGVVLSLGLGVTLLAPLAPGDAPLLDWSAPLETIPESDHLALIVDETTLNRLLYVAWKAGVFDLKVDQAMFDRDKTEIQLVAGFLGDYLTGLSAPVNPETPIAVEFSAPMPPLFDLGQDSNAQLRLLIPTYDLLVRTDLGSPVELVKGALSGEFSLSLGWEGEALTLGLRQLALELNLGRDGATNPGLFEAFTDTIFGPAQTVAARMLHQLVLPQWQGVRVDRLGVSRVGSDKRHLMIEVESSFLGGGQ